MIRLRALLVVSFLALQPFALPTGARAQGEPAQLPVTRLVLFTTGVGLFEHEGVVEGSQEIELRVDHAHMDDLLASLVLEDLDGGRVLPVRYGARDPLARVLASYALDLSRDPTLALLLAQARGEELRVETDEIVRGVLVNVERVTLADGGATTLLTLASATGLRRVALEDVRELRFEREEVRAELDAALAAIARARDADASVVRIRFEGEGARRVRIAYVREMPVWKPTYRLVLRDDGRADLQGWAILDNPTHMDLLDVQVAFVAGSPISFIASLYESVYVDRPRVGVDVAQPFVPPADGGAFARSMPMAAEMDMAMAAPSLIGAGVEAMADGVGTLASFAYVVRFGVSVGRFESVMVPILLAEVAAPRSSVFFAATPSSPPLRAVRLVNDTGLHLPAGPVTLYDAAGFAGAASLADVPPGEERLLAYAVDLEARVAVETSSEPEAVIAARLRGALLETVHRTRVRDTVRIGGGPEPRTLVIEIPRRTGYRVVAPGRPSIETADAHRFVVAWPGTGGDAASDEDALPAHVTCGDEGPCRLEVVFERVETRTVTLANVDSSRLVLFLENVELGDADRAALEAIVVAQRRLASLARDGAFVQARLDGVFRDQERVRQNMSVLAPSSSLYRRYLAHLEAQEDEVATIVAERDALRAATRAAQDELDALLLGLGEETVD